MFRFLVTHDLWYSVGKEIFHRIALILYDMVYDFVWNKIYNISLIEASPYNSMM